MITRHISNTPYHSTAQIYQLPTVNIHRRKEVALRIAWFNVIINLFKIQFLNKIFIYFY
nr:hypothetical protein HNKKKWOX_HNKKKWOX_CDS_0002 [Microvirus sp.]